MEWSRIGKGILRVRPKVAIAEMSEVKGTTEPEVITEAAEIIIEMAGMTEIHDVVLAETTGGHVPTHGAEAHHAAETTVRIGEEITEIEIEAIESEIAMVVMRDDQDRREAVRRETQTK